MKVKIASQIKTLSEGLGKCFQHETVLTILL